MDYTDLEGGVNVRTNIRRKWNTIPRILRFYILFGSIFLIAFIFAYSYLAAYTPKVDGDEHEEIKILNHHSSQETTKELSYSGQSLSKKDNKVALSEDKSAITDGLVMPSGSVALLTAEDFKRASLKQNPHQKRIQEAIRFSWKAYRNFAWGEDHLKPISKTGHNWFHIGLTILDSLDTLQMAGLDKEYNEGLEWVKNELSFDVYQDVNCFETTIRALGGLLSAFHLSQDKVLLAKANDLGDRLIHCFDSPSRTVPLSDVNLKTKAPKAPKWSSDSSLSEVSSMQLEFRDLTYETKNQLYEDKSFTTSKHIHDLVKARNDPLLPMYISPISGQLTPAVVTLGARADSYYEYLYKQYLQIGKDFLLEDYIDAIGQIKERLMRTTKGSLNLAYIGEIFPSNKDAISPKMDHLVCFLSGTLALGYYHQKLRNVENYRGHPVSVDNKVFTEHLKMAEDLARTCHYMYNLTETGLSPEIAYFGLLPSDKEYTIRPADTHNLLRPEFVESLFFLYHITGKQVYRDWGLQVFNAFEKYSRVPSGGYTTINDVRNPHNVRPRDMMESFWLAETLKYLYLLFLDDKRIVNSLLNNYIFNTEGHLIRRRINE